MQFILKYDDGAAFSWSKKSGLFQRMCCKLQLDVSQCNMSMEYVHLFRRFQPGSIATRIQLGFSIIFLIIVFGLFMQWFNLSRLEWQLRANLAISELVDSIRDLRRIEKNWFLYHDPTDLTSAENAIRHIHVLMKRYQSEYVIIGNRDLLLQLNSQLQKYHNLLQNLTTYPEKFEKDIQKDIRNEGQGLIDLANRFQEEDKKNISVRIDSMNHYGMVSGILVFALILLIGKKLSDSVVRPLNDIVSYTRRISPEKYEEERMESGVAEIDAVMQSLDILVKKVKQREKQILHQTRMATRGTLLAGIAHELNNPLSNISTSAEILNEKVKRDNHVDADLLNKMSDRIVDQTDRARRIIRSLLEFSRERELHMEKTPIRELLNEVRNLVQGKLSSKIELDIVVSDDREITIDRQRIQQVLINLVLNAIHAVNGKGKISIRGDYEQKRNLTIIEVHDTGEGISDDIINNIFDPFFTTKDVGEGSGLGLAVSSEIIHKHGGSIRVESRIGEGSVFQIRLPGERS